MTQVVMGVDPGSRHTGFGVIRGEGGRLNHLAHGQIAAKSTAPIGSGAGAMAAVFELIGAEAVSSE